MHPRLRNERGATLVEYAMAVALILVVSLAGIQWAQNQSQSKLTTRAAGIGTPAENTAVRAGSGSGGGSGGGGGGGTTTANVTSPPTLTKSNAPDNGNHWVATIVITVVDSNGNTVAGATVTGDWNPDTNSETASCTTSLSGTCTVTIANLNQNNQTSVNFAIGANGVTGNGTNLTVNYTGGATSATVGWPTP